MVVCTGNYLSFLNNNGKDPIIPRGDSDVNAVKMKLSKNEIVLVYNNTNLFSPIFVVSFY